MGPDLTDPLGPVGDGQTELSDEDRLGLIPTYISTRGELSDAEQRNIARATLRRPPTLQRLLDDKFLRDLHASMFGQVWIWAGHYRGLETNIGVDPRQISAEIRTLVDDAKAWVESNTYELDELAARFHHRLVLIHPFKNGNGRHARVAGDYLIRAIGGEPFSWGAGLRVSTEELRSRYLLALRLADGDRNDIGSLVAFVRS